MAGAYCRFCDRRCFILRVIPADARWRPGETVHLATCAEGMAHDREQSGYDHTTAINPTATEPQYPQGTPEYDAYAAELRVELDKFAHGEI